MEQYISNIQQEHKVEQFIQNIKMLKNPLLLDQLRQIGDNQFLEEIQADLLKEQQKLIDYGHKEKQRAIQKYEQAEQQKNYYRRLDDQQEQLKEKFRKKNKALENSLKVKHCIEEGKREHIKRLEQA